MTMKGKRTAWLLIGVLLAAQVGLAGVWGEDPLAPDAGDAALILEQPQTEQPETDGDSTEEPVSTEGCENAVDALGPGTDSLEADALQEEPLDEGFTDQSVVVDSSEVDMRAVEAQDTYFVVGYADGSLEVRQIEPSMGISSLAEGADSEPAADLEDYVSYYEDLPQVAVAEPLLLRQVNDIMPEYTPNDPQYSNSGLWGLKWIGADRLYRMIPQSNLESVVVAVLDTGMDMNHPDLAGALASVVIDGAGTVHGYDAVGDTPDYVPDDGHGHGTHVAGTIAAIANNAVNVAGVAAGVKILPVRVLDNTGHGTSVDLIEGINWAADHGADIINMSLGGGGFSTLEQTAIDNAVAKGVVVVAAAGNNSNNWNSGVADLYSPPTAISHVSVHYPASYKNVIGVGSVGLYGPSSKLLISDYSNTGAQSDDDADPAPLDVMAPGEAVLSTYPDDTTATLSGTSMATPHVAAEAALLKAMNPDMTPAQIEARIKSTAVMVTAAEDSTYGGSATYYGAGVINAYAALGGDSDTRLNDLIITGAPFTFDPLERNYPLNWDSSITAISVTPVANNSGQHIKINGSLYSGSGAVAVNLATANDMVTVEVTSKDGTKTEAYTVLRAKPYADIPLTDVTMTGADANILLGSGLTPGRVLMLEVPTGQSAATVTVPTTDDGTTISATLPAMSVTKVTDSFGSIQVEIPEGTVVTAESGTNWGGTLTMPTVSTAASVSVSSATVNRAVILGGGNTSLTFSQAVRIVIPGLAGKKLGYVKNGSVVEITRLLSTDTQGEADGMPAGAEGKIDVGSDLVVWTKHLTEFVVYTPVQTTQSQSTGGGGGGGGGVSRVLRGGASGKLEMNNITLFIPEGAYSKEFRVDMNIVRYSQSPFASPQKQLTDVYVVKKTVQAELAKPVTFTASFGYDDIRKLYPTEDISLYQLDEAAKRWTRVTGSILEEKRSATGRRLLVLSAEFRKFTEFAVVAEQAIDTPALPVTAVTPDTGEKSKSPSDIQAHWGRVGIEKLIEKGAVSGYPDGTFRPDAAITRAEFLAILVKAQGMTGSVPSSFSDLNGHWAKASIEKAMAYGVTGGYSDGLFRPDAPITREEMAVMVDRSLRYASGAPLPGFTDGSQISAWAQESLQRIVSHQIMGGYPDGSFRPQGLATRAEACAVVLKSLPQ